MLPIFKKYHNSGVIVKQRAPDSENEPQNEQDESASEELKACAADFLKAIHQNDAQGIADALQAAFSILDAEPHVEGPHVEPHSYEAQNIKAGMNK